MIGHCLPHPPLYVRPESRSQTRKKRSEHHGLLPDGLGKEKRSLHSWNPKIVLCVDLKDFKTNLSSPGLWAEQFSGGSEDVKGLLSVLLLMLLSQSPPSCLNLRNGVDQGIFG